MAFHHGWSCECNGGEEEGKNGFEEHHSARLDLLKVCLSGREGYYKPISYGYCRPYDGLVLCRSNYNMLMPNYGYGMHETAIMERCREPVLRNGAQ